MENRARIVLQQWKKDLENRFKKVTTEIEKVKLLNEIFKEIIEEHVCAMSRPCRIG